MATELRLRDGTPAIVWSLLPTDREGLRDAYEHLSPESQLHRFLTPVPHLTDAMLVHLVDEVDGVDHVARVLFVLEEGPDGKTGMPAGVARMIRYPETPDAADVAVTVADEYQGRGAASALLAELMRHRLKGVDRIVTQVAADNPASLAMLRRLGPTTVEPDGANVLRVTIELPPRPDENSSAPGIDTSDPSESAAGDPDDTPDPGPEE